MTTPRITIERIGLEAQPVAIIDDFAADPDALREVAIAATFGTALHHYPGIRAPLPADYLIQQLPVIAAVLEEAFDIAETPEVVDASFSIVTTSPGDLSVSQRLPHCDAHARARIALVHYLSADTAGTAFYRHRSTGFETVDEARASIYDGQLEAELRHRGPPSAAYVDSDTPLFERTALVEAQYNRALIYRSFALHSGAIPADATLSADPGEGRLTVTGFLSAGAKR